MSGKKFTRISDDGVKFSNLDRFLVSNDFGLLWKNIGVKALERRWSDHTPIMLFEDRKDYGPKPFKFIDSWLKEDDIELVVRVAWNKRVVSNRPDCIFRDRLKNVKEELRKWSKERFGDLEKALRQKKEEVLKREKTVMEKWWDEEGRLLWVQERKQWLEL